MATHRWPIFGWQTKPDSTGDVWVEPYAIKATNDQWNHYVMVFSDTSTRIGVYGLFTVPQNYTDTANLVIIWAATVTSGDVEWDFDYRATGGNDTESLDQSGTQESVNSNDTAPSAANERMEITIALTDGNFAAGDTVQFFLARDGSDSGDTLSGDVLLFEAYFEYND